MLRLSVPDVHQRPVSFQCRVQSNCIHPSILSVLLQFCSEPHCTGYEIPGTEAIIRKNVSKGCKLLLLVFVNVSKLVFQLDFNILLHILLCLGKESLGKEQKCIVFINIDHTFFMPKISFH